MTKRKKSKVLHSAEGILLKTLPYGERDRILYVFTRERGLSTFIGKGAASPKSRGAMGWRLLMRANFLFEEVASGGMAPCREVIPHAYHLDLRENLALIAASCRMANALYRALPPYQEAPLLFDLFSSYLKRLGRSSRPENLEASFLLKFLKHEGLFTLPLACSRCGKTLAALFIDREGACCREHAAEGALSFDKEEKAALELLLHSRSFKELDEVELTKALAAKVEQLFSLALY